MRLFELDQRQQLNEFKFTALNQWLAAAKEFLGTQNKGKKQLSDYGIEDTGSDTEQENGKLYGRVDSIMLKNNQAFMDELKKFTTKYGASEAEVFGIIRGESAFNTKAFNSRSGAMGFFQWMPEVARELRTSTQRIYAMSADEQMSLYGDYAAKWTKNGRAKLSGRLAMLQAAPALLAKPDNHVVYKKGSQAWRDNEVWRPRNGGDITAGSISAYYKSKTVA